MEVTLAAMVGCFAYTMGFSFVFTRIYLNNLSGISKGQRLGQSIRDEAPQRHKSKAGTPTMGGIPMLIALILSTILSVQKTQALFEVMIVTFAYGMIGFLDDYIKVRMKHNLGLRAWQKLALQLVVAAVFAFIEYGRSSLVYLPYAKRYIDFGIWIIPFIILVMVATTNAVNLTDGLDGLASGVTTLVSLALCIFCYILGKIDLSMFSIFITGTCVGFLFYNKYPASIFMGDTGSLALGAAIAGVAVTSGLEFALLIIGGIYVAEALSVILQVFVFKTQNGRRLFRMAPLHHHFELGGWSENTVLLVFCFVTLMLIIIMFPGI